MPHQEDTSRMTQDVEAIHHIHVTQAEQGKDLPSDNGGSRFSGNVHAETTTWSWIWDSYLFL